MRDGTILRADVYQPATHQPVPVILYRTQYTKDMAGWLHYIPYQQFPPLQPTSPVVAPYFFTWLHHRTEDSYGKRWAPRQYYPRITIPVLNVEGWYKALGPVADSPINELMLAWWDHYLKGVDNGIGTGGPRVDYFQLGSNTWHTTTSWPPPGTRTTQLYLSSGGHANPAPSRRTTCTATPSPASPPDNPARHHPPLRATPADHSRNRRTGHPAWMSDSKGSVSGRRPAVTVTTGSSQSIGGLPGWE